MTSILTGLHPSVHGVERRGSLLSPAVTFLLEVLREHGYRTAFLATNPNVGSFFGYSRGFDDFMELYEPRQRGRVSPQDLVARSDQVVDRAKKWMEEVSEPFFLVVFVVDPHFPYEPRPDFIRYVDRNVRTPGQAPGQDPRHALYYGEVSFVDHSFGQLMDYLGERSVSEWTIAILTSDHGEEFFEHGQIGHGKALYDESTVSGTGGILSTVLPGIECDRIWSCGSSVSISLRDSARLAPGVSGRCFWRSR